MFMVGKKTSLMTTFKAGFYKTIEEAKEVASKESDSRCTIVIKEFAKHNYIARAHTREGYIWLERSE